MLQCVYTRFTLQRRGKSGTTYSTHVHTCITRTQFFTTKPQAQNVEPRLKAPNVTVANVTGHAPATITGNRIRVAGLPALMISFATVSGVTAVKITVYDTDADNNNAVLTEVTVLRGDCACQA